MVVAVGGCGRGRELPGALYSGLARAKVGAGELLRRRDGKIRAHRRPKQNKLGRPENRGSWSPSGGRVVVVVGVGRDVVA
jgi:hypothetical protein